MCIAIATEDLNILKKIPGVGPKMAGKIILELKDKITNDELVTSKGKTKATNNNAIEAISALKVLGYKQVDINNYINNNNLDELSVEDIIKGFLKSVK